MPRRSSKAANAQPVSTVVFGLDTFGAVQAQSIAAVAQRANARGSGLPTVDPQQKFDGAAPAQQQFFGALAVNLGTRRPSTDPVTTFDQTTSNAVAGNPIMAAFADQLARGLR
jgi:hypothetical protein